MSTLFITDKFYNKFIEDESAKKVINIYGYPNRDSFFNSIISFLNTRYPFLNIDNVDLMTPAEASVYSMYNGFVRGDFADYDEVLVSFSDVFTKEGNTIISQQVMPVLQQKISNNLNYLYEKRVKKIFLLTSHKSNVFSVQANSIKENSYGSTLQLLVKCLVTIGFDVYPFIPVLNLDTTSRFNSVKELVDNVNYIRQQNSGNLQHKQIDLNGNVVVGSFQQKPKGQDEKYFALRYLTAIFLNNHNNYDVSQAYAISEQSNMMEMLYRYAAYVASNDIIYNSSKPMSDEEFMELIEKEDEFLKKLKELAEKYGEDGTRVVTSTVRLAEVQDELRKRLIEKHGCKCLMCNTTNSELLIASHIKPASECDIYGKADLNNAFLLCAAHDKLFDRALISFSFVDGSIMISKKLTQEEKNIYNLDPSFKLPDELMTPERVAYLMWHNAEFEKKDNE